MGPDADCAQSSSHVPVVPICAAAPTVVQVEEPACSTWITTHSIETPLARPDGPFDAIPGPYGAHNWHPMSFNPTTGLVYLPAQNVPIGLMDDKEWKYGANLPGRALKAFLAGAALVRGPTKAYVPIAVLLAPYDLREMTMLGDAGSNALGAVLGFGSVGKLTARGRLLAIAALAGLTIVGETRSLGKLIERTPFLLHLDRLGRA